MGIFAHRAGMASPTRPEARVDLHASPPAAVPDGFRAVGEALASRTGALDACVATGRELGLDGVSLDEALEALATTYAAVVGTQPSYDDTRALALGWSEATLGYLHRLGCADPVTGLSSLAHLQSRITELYRGQLRGRPRVTTSHALVVVDVGQAGPGEGDRPADAFAGDLRAARLAEATRTVFAGDETVGRVTAQRLVVVADRDDRLAQRVALLRTLVDLPGVRAWVEGLPVDVDTAATLLAELARD